MEYVLRINRAVCDEASLRALAAPHKIDLKASSCFAGSFYVSFVNERAKKRVESLLQYAQKKFDNTRFDVLPTKIKNELRW